MPYYIINKNADNNGRNEVHTTACGHLPLSQNQVSLGWHTNALAAVNYAKLSGWNSADGCYYCCEEAHKG